MFRATLTLWLVSVPSLLAAQPPDPPVLEKGGVAPTVGVIEGVRGDKLVVRQTVFLPAQRTRSRPVTETITEDGQERQVTKNIQETYTVMEKKTVSAEILLDYVRAFDLDGKPIPTAQLSRLYARPGLALIAIVGSPVDPAYLRIARDGVPLIALPVQAPAKAVPMALPPPATEAPPPPAP